MWVAIERTPDRRTAHKARHRQAILDAADDLMRERGRPQFSVDELAARADVARRTVFNHFASLDEVVMTACTRVLAEAVDEFRAATAATPAANGSRASVFTEITGAVRGIDLPAVIAYLWRVLGEEDDGGRSHDALQRVFARTTEQISLETARRNAELDDVEVEILVSSVMNGLAVVAVHWIRQTGAALDIRSRALWDQLLDRLISAVRAGYVEAVPASLLATSGRALKSTPLHPDHVS